MRIDYEFLRNEAEESVSSASTGFVSDTSRRYPDGEDIKRKKSLRSSIKDTFFKPVKLMMRRRRQSNAENVKFMELLTMARDSSEEKLKTRTSEHPLLQAWTQGSLQPFCLWLLWLFVGTMVFGSVNFNGDFGKGFYYSVNVGYSIGWGVLPDRSTGCKVFSLFYILVGAVFVSRWLAYLIENAIREQDANAYDRFVLQRNLRRHNPFAKISKLLSELYVYLTMNASRLFTIYLWLIYLFVGAAWSCAAIGWPMIDGVFFSFTSLSTAGLWGIPADSPDLYFVIVGLFAGTGVPLMGMAMADLAVLFVALKQQTQSNLFGKVDLNQQEKLLLDIFRNDPERGDIDKNEFLLFHLVKRKLVPLKAIRKLSVEFERLDLNGAGVITYQDIVMLQERRKSEGPIMNPLQVTKTTPPNNVDVDDDDIIR